MTRSYPLPNLTYAWRMPLKAASWKLAWWLMRRVTMRGYTPLQQAATISQALGAYRPDHPPGALAPRVSMTSTAGTVYISDVQIGGTDAPNRNQA